MSTQILLGGTGVINISDEAFSAIRKNRDSYGYKALLHTGKPLRKAVCFSYLLSDPELTEVRAAVDAFAGMGVQCAILLDKFPGVKYHAFDMDHATRLVFKDNFPMASVETVNVYTKDSWPEADIALMDFYQFTLRDVEYGTRREALVRNVLDHTRAKYLVLTDSGIFRLHLNYKMYERMVKEPCKTPPEYYRAFSNQCLSAYGMGVRRVAHCFEAGYILLERGYNKTISMTEVR